MKQKNTRLISTNDPQALSLASKALSKQQLIAFPTDTLYGLGGMPTSKSVLLTIYAAKGRSFAKALPVLLSELEQLDQLVSCISPQARCLMQAFWPGPLTLILPKNSNLPEELTPYEGLAVRMPAHPFALELLKLAGPLAVTSANISDQPNPQSAQEVLFQLNGKVDLILDGGFLKSAQASTIVDCLNDEPKLIRQGPIPFDQILSAWSCNDPPTKPMAETPIRP